MLSGLYKQVCLEIRSLGITSYTPENASAVQALIARHLTPVPTARDGHVAHDPRGSDEVRKPRKNNADKPADVHKATKSRQRNK